MREKRNHHRIRINEEGLLRCIDKIKDSDRNKEITIKYANGATYGELANEYGISTNRVEMIIFECIRKMAFYIKQNEK